MAGAGAASKRWGRKERLAFAELLVVQLPAEYTFPQNKHDISGWQVRAQPSLSARAIGTLSIGDKFTVVSRKGLWLEFTPPRCQRRGWALAEVDGVTYIRPAIPRVQYPWQRARGSGLMYEDVLIKRREVLRGMDLAQSDALLREWLALIAELDAVMRLSKGYVALVRHAGSSAINHCGTTGDAHALQKQARRPRSNSFFGPRKQRTLTHLPSEAAGAAGATAHLRRPRANSFTPGQPHTQQPQGGYDAQQWAAWRAEANAAVRGAKPVPGSAAAFNHDPRSGDELLREQEERLARAKTEAHKLMSRQQAHAYNVNRLLTEQRLREHDLQQQRKHGRRERASSFSALPAGLALPGTDHEPDVSSLYKWSWEGHRLNPTDYAVDAAIEANGAGPAMPHSRESRGRTRSRHHYHGHGHGRRTGSPYSERDVSPARSVRSNRSAYSARSGLSQRSTATTARSMSMRGGGDSGGHANGGHNSFGDHSSSPKRPSTRRKRSQSLPTRRADGARTHLYIPADID